MLCRRMVIVLGCVETIERNNTFVHQSDVVYIPKIHKHNEQNTRDSVNA